MTGVFCFEIMLSVLILALRSSHLRICTWDLILSSLIFTPNDASYQLSAGEKADISHPVIINCTHMITKSTAAAAVDSLNNSAYWPACSTPSANHHLSDDEHTPGSFPIGI